MGGELRRIQVQNLIDNGKLLIGDGYRAKNTELSANGLPFARAGNINNGFHFEDADRFPYERIHRVGSKISQAGDVVFTSKGTVGRFALVRPDTERFVYSPQLCFWRSLDPSFIDPRFLYYWMHSREFYVQYKSVSGQTDMAEYVSLSDQRRMYISLPPLAQQRAIAHILGTLDDKIELNRRMNETLEAMARALFKSWFVDFDPVRAKAEGRTPSGMDAETAKLFPSEFVDSELEPIPKGWRRTVLSEAAELNPKRALKKGALAPYVEMSSLPTSGHRPSQWPMRPVGSGARFQNGDTLLARITPCLENGKTAFVDFLGEGEVGWGSTEYIVIAPRAPLPAEWGYLLARDETFRDFAKQKMEGSTGRQRVPAGALGQYLVTVPPAHVAARFGQIVRSWFQRMARGYEESSTLARLRDELLPRLLSGELPVDAAERVVEEVA